MGYKSTGLRVHERLGHRLGTTTCPICANAEPLNAKSRNGGSLQLTGHPSCHSCSVLMGEGHAESQVAETCEWCETHPAASVTPRHEFEQRIMRRDREMTSLHGEGMVVEDIARRYRIRPRTVRRILNG